MVTVTVQARDRIAIHRRAGHVHAMLITSRKPRHKAKAHAARIACLEPMQELLYATAIDAVEWLDMVADVHHFETYCQEERLLL